VLQPVIFNTVNVYANSSGNRTIEVIDPQGNTYIDTTIYITANPNNLQAVTLNFPLYPGVGYFIKCRGLVDLWRNDAGAIYPYPSTAINITASNAGSDGYYYFFYNWTYTSFDCNTPRTIVTAMDTCGSVGINDLVSAGSFTIYPNPNNGVFDLSFNIEKTDNYNIQVMNALGEIAYQENLGSFSGKYLRNIDISSFGKGVYMVAITNSKNETIKKVMVY
jgi:hypothetical protein